MSRDELRALLTDAATDGAATSALAVLLGLARDGDFDSIIALVRALASELGYDGDAPGLTAPHSLEELVASSDVPPLLRAYALAFRPHDFLASASALAWVGPDEPTDGFASFQHLVRRDGVLQHEALKAYVLCAFAAQITMHAEMGPTAASPAALLRVLDGISTVCRVVPGNNADASLRFGRELIVRTPHSGAFSFAIGHELGHTFLDILMSGAASAPALLGEGSFRELSRALGTLIASASRLRGIPLRADDPRHFKTGAGLSVICTHPKLPGGEYFHWSLSQNAGYIELRAGSVYAFFVLSVLGVDLSRAAVAYSRRGVFHFGFAGETSPSGAVDQRVAQCDTDQLAKAAIANSRQWMDALALAGRVGQSDVDVGRALGIAASTETFYGILPERTLRDLNLIASVRSAESLAALPEQGVNIVVGAAWRSADAAVLRQLLLCRSAPREFLQSSALPISQIGESVCAIKDERGLAFHGPTAADVFEFLRTLREFGGDLDAPVGPSGRTLLTGAASRNVELVRLVLDCGGDPNCSDGNGETPLLVGATLGSVDVSKELIAAQASVHATSSTGDTPLHRAATRTDSQLAQLLIASGANVGARNHTGETPLMHARSAEMVEVLFQAGAVVGGTTPDGTTALHNAASANLAPVVRALLAHGADVDAANSLGETALHHATLPHGSNDDLECMEVLLDAGADMDEETNQGITPLMVAAARARRPAVGLLIGRGADVNARNTWGSTALILSSDGKNEWTRDFSFNSRIEECLRDLVTAGADVNAADDTGMTALHAATRGFDAGRVRLLLELGADAGARTRAGVTPLGIAAMNGHGAMLEALIAAGARIDASDDEGYTPLLLAINAEESNADVVRQLLQAGASVSHANSAGETALTLVARDNANADVRKLVREVRVVANREASASQ